MFCRFLLLGLILGAVTGCAKDDPLTEEQKKIKQELKDQGVTVHGTEVLDVDLRGSKKVTPKLLKTIISFGNISYLNLSDSNITDEGMAILKDAKSVETLFLTGTKISDAGLEPLTGLSGLIILHLPDTITDEGFKFVGEITTLKTLSAERCKITDVGMAHLVNMSELQWLKMNHTAISDKGLDAIKDLTTLHTLELMNTKITDKGLLFLSGLSKLNSLEMTGCDLSDEAVQALQKELPDTEIVNGIEIGDTNAL
jgi:Leucine-rich repeat (LRR) protein